MIIDREEQLGDLEMVRRERGVHRRLLFGSLGPALGRGMIPNVLVHVALPDALAPWDDPRLGWRMRPRLTVAQRGVL